MIIREIDRKLSEKINTRYDLEIFRDTIKCAIQYESNKYWVCTIPIPKIKNDRLVVDTIYSLILSNYKKFIIEKYFRNMLT